MPRTSRRQLRTGVLVVAAFLVPTLLLFAPIFRGQVPLPTWSIPGLMTGEPARESTPSIFRDRIVQAYPYHDFAAQAIHAGRIPLWNTLLFAGTPFFATGQAGVLSIVKLPWWSLPSSASFILATLTQFLVGGVGMYLLGRSLGWRPLAASTAGFVLILSGPFVMRATVTNMSATVAMLPWVLWSVSRLQETLRWRWVAVTALILGLLLLNGHVQLGALMVAVTAGWMVVGWRPNAWRRRLILCTLALVVGVSVAGAQLLPTKEALGEAYRQPKDLTAADFQPWTKIFQPNTQYMKTFATIVDHDALGDEGTYRGGGNYLEGNFYLGPIAILMILLSARAWRNRYWRYAGLLSGGTALAIILPWVWNALGAAAPWLTMTPVWRLSFVMLIGLSIMVGFGAEALLGRLRQYAIAVPTIMVALMLWQWQGILPFAERGTLYPERGLREVVHQHLGQGRLWPIGGALDQFMPYEIPVVFGYDSLYPETYLELWRANSELKNRNQLHAENPTRELLMVTGTTGLLTNKAIPDPWTFVAEYGPWKIGTALWDAPLAHAVGGFLSTDDPARLREIDPATAALIVGPNPSVTLGATVQITDRTPERLRLRVTHDGAAGIVTTMQHYPGWGVTIDGQESELRRVNHAFLGVIVPAGDHVVEFRYAPASLRYGLALSAAGVAALAVMLILDRRRVISG